MKLKIYSLILIAAFSLSGAVAEAEGIAAKKVDADLTKVPVSANLFDGASEVTVSLMAQPMAIPRPKDTTTTDVKVKAVYNGKWAAFLLKWKDTEKSEAGKLGEFSDAVAMEFPMKPEDQPPVFMGMKDMPVHIIHWRAQYQRDKEKGKPEMKDLYPNLNADAYPMEFKDYGNLKKIDPAKQEAYAYGKAAGNPQSFPKEGVDEIFAEGFGTSAVVEKISAKAHGEFKDGEWEVVITRPLKSDGASLLETGKTNNVGFAIWQGGKDEVGSRKCVTMSWTPLQFVEK